MSTATRQTLMTLCPWRGVNKNQVRNSSLGLDYTILLHSCPIVCSRRSYLGKGISGRPGQDLRLVADKPIVKKQFQEAHAELIRFFAETDRRDYLN